MLLSLEKNLHRFDTVKTFETGLVYRNDMPGQQFSPTSEAVLPEQKRMLGMTYADKSIGVPFREITFALTNTFSKFGLELKFRKSEAHTLYHPGRCAEVLAGDVVVGRVGELHPVIGARIGIDFPVGLSELDLSIMVDLIHHVSDYRELSEYPSVTRDIAIVVDREIEVKAVYQLLTGYDPLIESVRLFDVYTGVGVSSGSKSLAFSIVYRSSDHTLESGEVDTVHGRVIDIIKKEFKAEIR
jgi:phenylalanyl-tRNA synthetase beta chain